MIVEDFEAYAARHGAGRSLFGEAGLHKRGNMSDAAHRRAVVNMMEKDRVISERRMQLAKLYEAELIEGELRKPTREERIIESAIGHPDLPSVQAARRICKKNGWPFALFV